MMQSPNSNECSTAQLRVLRNDRVKFLGWDEKRRPVVEGKFGIPHQLRRWAILRNGGPTDVTGTITGCRHKKWQGGYCAEMACPNYINKHRRYD